MPGNGVGDRVHNFFAQDTLSQGQQQTQVLDQNHPALNHNLWVGNQGPIGFLSYSTKGFNLQQSVDTGRGSNSHLLNGPPGLNFTRSASRPEIHLQSQQQNLNGYTYGNLYETQQDEGNYMAVDIGSDQRNLASVDSSFYEQSPQGVGPQLQAQPVSSGASLSSGNFGLFGGQQQMSRQHSNMLHPLHLQQSGIKDMQLQQQVMFMKMQELQRQHKLQQLDARQQNSQNQIFPFQKVAPSSHSSPLVHSNIHSGAVGFPCATDTSKTNWLQGSSSALQVSSNGFLSSNHGQGHHIMGLTPQQIEQSLFGVPVSTSRVGISQYSQAVTDKTTMQQSVSFNSSFPFRQYAQSPDQIGVQDGPVASRQKFMGENFSGHGPNQSPINNTINMESLQEVNAIQHSAAIQEFQAREELATPSVNTQEKTSKQTASHHNEVGLDPTEERILFGSDDNIWAAFGKSPNMGEGACNSLDGSGLLIGLPSQGGTWSALMQSAVAEASSTDVGPQEEWSGLNFHSTVVPPGYQNISTDNNGQPSGSDNTKNSYVNLPGFQQIGHKFSNEIGQNMQSNPVQRLVQPSEEGCKWPDVAPLQMSGAEGSRMQMNTSHPFATETEAKRISSSWMDELGAPSKTCDKLNDWNALGPAMPTEDASGRIHSSQNSKSLDDSQKKSIHGEAVRTGLCKADSETRPAVNLELTRSPANAPVNSEHPGLKSADTIVKPNSLSDAEETSRFISNQNQVNYQKNAKNLVRGNESQSLERSQSCIIKDSHILNSLETTSQRDVTTHEADTRDKQENSNDSYQSNVSHQNSAGSLRENVLLDSSDSRSLATGKEKLSNSAHKIQYHPMGNLDEYIDPPYGMQKPLYTRAMTPQTAHFGHPKLFIQGQSSNVLRDGKGLADLHSQSCFPSSVLNISAPLTRSVDIPLQIMSPPSSSPSVLQLLPKVDQSRVFGATMRQNASSSDMPNAENSDGSVGRMFPSHSSSAQVFGLQLGPPSQLTPVQNHLPSSQSSMQTFCSSSPSHSAVEIGEKPHIASMSPGKSFPSSSETAQGEFANKSGVPTNDNNENSRYKMHGKFPPAFSSGFPYPRSRIQNQLMATGQELKSHSASTSLKDPPCFTEEDDTSNSSRNPPCFTEEDDSQREPSCGLFVKNFSHEMASNIACSSLPNSLDTAKQASIFDPHEAPNKSVENSLSVSQLPSSSSMSQQASLSKTMDMTWSTSQDPFAVISREEPSSFSCLHQSNIVGTSSGPENQGVSSRIIDSVQKMDKAQEEHIIKNHSDVYPVCSASMQRDIEAFGRSLKPNNFSHHNYSLLNQIHVMKNAKIEQSNKALKRSRATDDCHVGQHVSHVAVPSVDSKMPNFSEADHFEGSVTSQEVNVPTQDINVTHMDDSQTNCLGNNASSVKFEHTHVSTQMAPTWFSHYGSGTLQNGKVLAMHDAQKAALMKISDSPLTLGKSSSSLHTFNTMHQPIPDNSDISQHFKTSMHPIPSAASEQFCSSPSFSVGIGDQHSLQRPKKRRHATSDLSPWYKVVSQGLQSLQMISMGERDWAKAANRVVEKVKEDADLNENAPPRLRARRRLIFTTQLMQQLFRPPQTAILSANSAAEYEAVTYLVSRLALCDACGVVSRSNDDYIMAADGKDILSSNCKTLEGNDRQRLSKVMEEFTGRARKLEEEFLKLDKRVSLVDLVTESQDLEKFSVINRFAKFYGRGQADGADTSTSSDAATHPFAQRYVTPFPMPKEFPSGVQCFSL